MSDTVFHRGLLVEPDNCSNCYLKRVCERVPSEGNPHASIALVGMGPGWEEAQQHKPFIGRSGQLLDVLLQEAGLSRSDIWICNCALGMPRAFRARAGGMISKAKVEKHSIQACRGRLLKELAIVKPRVVVAIGALPMEALTDDRHGMTRLVGSLNPLTRDAGFDAIVVPSFHPAHLLRGEQRFFPVVVSCLEKAKKLAHENPKPLGDLFVVDPCSATIDADLDKLDALVDDILRTGEDIAVDVETTDATPRDCALTVVGFGSLTRRLGVAITVRVWSQDLQRFVLGWSPQQWRRVNRIISRLLGGRNTKIYHNYGFDVTVLERFYIIGGRVRDTLILHHLAWPDVLHGLDFVAQNYLHIPPWKYIFRQGEKNATNDHRALLIYNAQDALYTALLLPLLEAEALARGNLHIEDHQLACADLARRAHLRGLPVDLQQWQQIYDAHAAVRDKCLSDMRAAIVADPDALASFTESMKRKRYARAIAAGKVVELKDVQPLSSAGMDPALKVSYALTGKLDALSWNPNSNDHGSWFLYEWLKLVPTRFTTGGAEKDPNKQVPSASYKGVLVYMQNQLVHSYVKRAEEEAVLRRLNEIRNKVDDDGFARPHWNTTSMKGTRWVSKFNAQNLDKTLKKLFVAPDGWSFVAADAGQIEYRIAAFLAGIAELLKLFNAPPYDENHPDEKWKKFSKDYDAHSLIAEEVFQDLFRNGPTELKSALRTMVKRVVYALFYGAFPEKIYTTILEDHRVPSEFRRIVSLEYIERIHSGFTAQFPEWPRWADQETVNVRFLGQQVFPPFNRVRAWSMPWMVEETKIRNTPIQLAAGDIVNKMFVAMDVEVRARALRAVFVLHGHDACTWLVHDDDVPALIELVNRHFDTWLHRHDDRLNRDFKVHITGQAKAGKSLADV